MTLLDDARRLADQPPMCERRCYECVVCGGCFDDYCRDQDTGHRGHKSDCPWLSMSKIVAALEAAERLTVLDGEPGEYSRGEDAHYHAFCERPVGQGHESDCPWQALVAALKGDA